MDLRSLVVGVEQGVPLADGTVRPYVSFDNAASTPPFRAVLDAVNRFASWYGNVHRGTGFKSRLSSGAYDDARRIVERFVGADPARDMAVFTRNTTESLNHLAQQLVLPSGSVVISTLMEHHSNDLPWRRAALVVRVGLDAAGAVDEDALRRALRQHRGRVALLAVSGASNVTGIINPVHRWARLAHEEGARIVVDAAQLVPHREVSMRPAADPEHLDFLAFSAHKMYAPFGTGVLVGPRAFFDCGEPRLAGGGTVDIVDTDRVVWASAPDREEAGTPCIVGAVALAAAIGEYQRIGWSAMRAHETALTRETLAGLAGIPGVRVYGDADPTRAAERLGVIAFNVEGMPHALVSAILSDEWGIGTRSGCFCAHPYVKALLGISADASAALQDRIIRGDRGDVPGAVRASFGLSNAPDDAGRLVTAVRSVAEGRYATGYTLDAAHGEWLHAGACSAFDSYFQP